MRIRNYLLQARYAAATGTSPWQKLRLFYHTAIKPSLVFRGLAKCYPTRILCLSIKAPHQRTLMVHVRDNGVGIITIREFFSAQSTIMPADLPPFQPKVIYDLGANVGIASLFFNALYPEATIYGFEPLPENLEVCALNYRNLPDASRVFPWAIGAQSGTALFDCQNDSRGGRLASSPHDPKLKTVGKMEVQVYSIGDPVAKQGLLPPDFLKVDVEGAEMDVLTGLEEHQHGLKGVYVETHGEQLKKECEKWMEHHGFNIWPGPDETAIWGVRC